MPTVMPPSLRALLFCGAVLLGSSLASPQPQPQLSRAALEATYDELQLDAYSRRMSQAFQQLLEEEGLGLLARNNSMGFWAAVRTQNATVVASVGYQQIEQPQSVGSKSSSTSSQHQQQHQPSVVLQLPPKVPPHVLAKATDIVPAGSLMKSMTAAAIMRYVEAGALDLDAPITQYANQFLMRANGTTLEALFGPNIANTTVRSCLSMRVGFNTYDDGLVQKEGFAAPSHDITPDEYLMGS